MVKEFLVVRSSISSALLKTTLLRGFAIAFIGICILLFAGSFLSVEFLHKWGWSLFLIALGFITLGLLPYRNLSRLQIKPNELILLNVNSIAYVQRGHKILTLPIVSIAQISYISYPHSPVYGIAVWFKPSSVERIIIHQSLKEIDYMRKQGQKMGNADIFLPYFNQHAYDELMDWLFEKEEKN
jgi:hypothetical protein